MASHQRTWDNYHKFAPERASLVIEILQRFTSLAGKQVLDFGCGRGTLARLLTQFGAVVTAVDIDPLLEPLFASTGIQFHSSNHDEWLKKGYDLIVLQDVLEHIVDPNSFFAKLNAVLPRGGLLYISTPNRLSVLNFIADPHWSLPGVALLPRPAVAFVVPKVARRDQRQRSDWPALLSLGKLTGLLERHGFQWIFVNKFVAQKLFQCPASVVCHPGHLMIVHWLQQHHFHHWIIRAVNDQRGLFNWLINPTWYIIGMKK